MAAPHIVDGVKKRMGDTLLTAYSGKCWLLISSIGNRF